MARYEIFVVTTEHPNVEQLEALRVELSNKFGGVTVVPNCRGYWVGNEKLYVDCTEIWLILSSTVIPVSAIMDYAERLKKLCNQQSQLFAINNQPYFV